MNKKYFELKLKINPEQEDLISEIFFENFECDGVILAEETYKNLEMVSTTEGTLRVFLKDDEDTSFEEMKLKIENTLHVYREGFLSRGMSDKDLGSWDWNLEEKDSQDWSQKWKEKWDVTHVTDKIAVVPDWIEYKPKKDEIIIKMEPGCAFGTGTHQTTQLCMKALEKYLKKSDTVADIGTGSGILAILAIKLGASYAYGCDIDADAIEVAKQNAIKNGVNIGEQKKDVIPSESEDSHTLSLRAGIITPCVTFEVNTADKIHNKFDFVCANILHNVLDEIMGDLKNIMKDDGLMSLSGILDEKRQIVLDAINRENLKIIEEIHQDQWTSFIVVRK